MIRQILTVCIGNICRSPMAEGLFRRALPEAQISSAGLAAIVGRGADPIAVQLMADAGIDISGHRARMLTDEMARAADIILVMDDQQKQHVSMQFQYARGKLFRLGEAAGQDIPDPFQQGHEAFRSAFSMIERGVKDWVKRINSVG